MRRYIQTWPPTVPWLLLMGTRGTGKTHLAIGVLRELWARHGRIGAFWPVRDLLERVRATFDADRATESEHEITQQLNSCPLLVLDDYERRTDWEERWLYTLLNSRYNGALPTVVTTNLALGEDRIVDRVCDRQSTVLVTFRGASYRTGGDR